MQATRPTLCRALLAASLLLVTARDAPAAAAPAPDAGLAAANVRTSDIFRTDHVWDAHFTLTPDQWAALQPRNVGRGNASAAAGEVRNGFAANQGVVFDTARASLEIGGLTFREVGLRYKGNGTFAASRGSLKISLKVDLNEFTAGQSIAGITTLNFHSNVRDVSNMNEALAYRFFRDAGVPAPRTGYARVYITVPGVHDRAYAGLYSLVENIDRNFLREHLPPGSGALFKPVAAPPFTDLGPDWDAYVPLYDPKTTLTEDQRKRLLEICAFVSHATPGEFAARVGEFVDLQNFAAFMAVTTWIAHMDSLLSNNQNYYAYIAPGTGKLMFLPWDQDESWGQVLQTQEARNNLSIHEPWLNNSVLLQKTFATESFRQLYYPKLADITLTLGRPERIAAQIDAIATVIRPAVAAESGTRLEQFEQSVAGRPMVRTIGVGRNDFLPVRSFVAAREQSILRQLLGN